MKLWFKIFLATLSLFLIAFNLGIFFLSNIVYKASLDTARDQAFAQHNFVTNLLARHLTIILAQERDMEKARNMALSDYAGYFENRGVRLELIRDNVTVYGSVGASEILDQLNPGPGMRQSVISSQDGRKHIYVAGYMPGPFSDYLLIYSQEITDIAAGQEALTNKLIVSGMILTLVFMVVLYIILKRLMKPVRVLQRTSEEIAAGAYNVRADIKGNDEIALLGSRLNTMADEILSRMEEERQNSLAKQQFIDNFAHELRTPLTTLYGYAEFLQRANSSDDERIAATDHIMRHVRRIQDISAKLLELSLTRRAEIVQVEIPLAGCFERVQTILSPSLAQGQIDLEISCDDQIILGNDVLIEQLLINLIDNAIKASPEGSRISLKASQQDPADESGQAVVLIEIADHGIGMEPEQIERIFEPFYRVDVARSRASGGAGLGLSLCKQIVDAHHAEIEVASQIGQGTVVTLCFATP
ncbi:MAG: HAMP domain-containing histidine kinase [Peptococcaceae bacterium]|nr:HAMP domain-containing histidine kinase [Peptococcaceae bacterium]